MRWTGHVARMGEMRNSHKILVGKLEGVRPLERPRMDVRGRGWEGVDSAGSRTAYNSCLAT